MGAPLTLTSAGHPTASGRLGGVATNDRIRSQEISAISIKQTHGETFDRLLRESRAVTADISFREIVGPLPADEYTHGVFPYPARLLRQIPRFALGSPQITQGIDTVLDPFAGSGTVLLESQLHGFRAQGIDQNPIAALVSRVKTGTFNADLLQPFFDAALADAKRSRRSTAPAQYLERWYSPNAFAALGRLATRVAATVDSPLHDPLSLLLVLTARRVSMTDRRIPVPVKGDRNTNATAQSVWSAYSAESTLLLNKLRRLPPNRPPAVVINGDARDGDLWPTSKEGRTTLLISSPPYGAAQKYIRSTSLDAGWIGLAAAKGTIELERASIGREHLSQLDRESTAPSHWDARLKTQLERIAKANSNRAAIYTQYFTDMERVVSNAASSQIRRLVLITGTNTVCGEVLPTNEFLGHMIQNAGFVRTLSLRDSIRGRALLTARKNSTPSPAEYFDVYEWGAMC